MSLLEGGINLRPSFPVNPAILSCPGTGWLSYFYILEIMSFK